MTDADRIRISRRGLLLGAGAGIAAAQLTNIPGAWAEEVPDFKGERMVVNTYGGTFGAAWKQHVIDPFEKKFNATIALVDAITGQATAKVLASRSNPQLDVVILGDSGAAVLAHGDALQPLTEATIPNLKDLIPKARLPGDPYAEFLFVAEVVAYNKNDMKAPPDSWADFEDPKYKRRLLIPDLSSSVAGPVFLVQEAILHGGSAQDIAPGFTAIEQMKPNVLAFWTSHQQFRNLIASGAASFGVWNSDRAAALILSGAPVALAQMKEGHIIFGNGIGIARGTKHLKMAETFVNFVLSAPVQQAFLPAAILTPTNRYAKMPAKLAPFLADPEHGKTIDWGAVAQNMPKWLDQWNRTILQ